MTTTKKPVDASVASKAKTAKVAKNSKAAGRGSKPGERRGGRRAGTKNKKNAELIAKVEAEGLTPLQVMIGSMREIHAKAMLIKPDSAVVVDGKVVTRISLLEAASSVAKDAAPYVHAKLSAIELTGKDGGPVEVVKSDLSPEEAYMMMVNGKA